MVFGKVSQKLFPVFTFLYLFNPSLFGFVDSWCSFVVFRIFPFFLCDFSCFALFLLNVNVLYLSDLLEKIMLCIFMLGTLLILFF